MDNPINKPTDNPASTAPRMRVASVDIYRGMVMFLMLAEVMHLDKAKETVTGEGWWASLASWVTFHTSHVPWRGCSLHDMIQPSFSFLVGTAMAFSLVARSSRGQSWGSMFGHAILRSVILVSLGIFLRSMGKPIVNFTFDDTLTQIGLGYWILFLLSRLPSRGLIVAVAIVLIGYWAVFVSYPAPPSDFPYQQYGVPADWPEHYQGLGAHFNKNSNAAWAFDRWWMNLFPREKEFLFSGGGYCTLSFIPTLATMLLGLIAGKILTSERPPQSKQAGLWLSGLLCVLIALMVDGLGLCPIVKRIWTPSWALWSGGLCFAWLALLNLVCDWGGYKSWGWMFVVIGANSIVAYVMSWVLEEPIQKAIAPFVGSFRNQLGDLIPFVSGALTLLVMWLILWFLYRKRIFVRI